MSRKWIQLYYFLQFMNMYVTHTLSLRDVLRVGAMRTCTRSEISAFQPFFNIFHRTVNFTLWCRNVFSCTSLLSLMTVEGTYHLLAKMFPHHHIGFWSFFFLYFVVSIWTKGRFFVVKENNIRSPTNHTGKYIIKLPNNPIVQVLFSHNFLDATTRSVAN